MPKKLSPYIFLIILGFILIFILGTRYGQQVEKTNKAVNFLLSLPPTKKPEPTKKPLTFKKYEFKECSISFIYPNNLAFYNDSANKVFSINLDENSENKIRITCISKDRLDFWPGTERYSELKTATESFMFKSQKLKVVKTNEYYLFALIHPLTKQTIYVNVDSRYLPLFEKSLEFLP